MKALTLTQPWATLVIIGAKHFETRNWSTLYRGPLAIHAAQGLAGAGMTLREWIWLCTRSQFIAPALYAAGIRRASILPRGVVLGIVDLEDCARIRPALVPDYPELAFGNFALDRFMWRCENPKRFAKPVPAHGRQGLWNWEPRPVAYLPTAA